MAIKHGRFTSTRAERTRRHGDFVVTPHRVRSAIALSCAVTALALSVGEQPADAATLNGIRIDAGSGAGRNPRVILAFANGVPNYKIFGNGTTDVTLILQGSTRGVNAPTTVIGRDPLKSISVDNFGDSLNVTFHESAAANVTVGPGPGQTLLVTIASSGGELNALATPAIGPAVAPAAATPAPPGSDLVEVVPLKYADVSEVVGLLVSGQQIPSNDSFTPQEQQFGSAGISGGGNGLGTNQLGGQVGGLNNAAQGLTQVQNFGGGGGTALGQQINENIGVDRRLNAIILTGTPDIIERLKAKIAKIDIPLSSVELETQIVELTDTAAKDIGLDFGAEITNVTYAIKNLTTGQGTLPLQAAVYAQIQKGQGRTIARPRITALDGTSAQIVTGNQIPILNTVTLSGVNGTTSQVQYISVGVSLQIQPRINSDGFVTSHIFSQVSSVTGSVTSNGQSNPTLSQREASTSATVRDGDSFVIGGLLQQNDLSSVSKLPGLGDIPVVGGLFHVRHDTSTNTNLYIIVTPHILKNGVNPPPARALPSPLPPLPSIKK